MHAFFQRFKKTITFNIRSRKKSISSHKHFPLSKIQSIDHSLKFFNIFLQFWLSKGIHSLLKEKSYHPIKTLFGCCFGEAQCFLHVSRAVSKLWPSDVRGTLNADWRISALFFARRIELTILHSTMGNPFIAFNCTLFVFIGITVRGLRKMLRQSWRLKTLQKFLLGLRKSHQLWTLYSSSRLEKLYLRKNTTH